MVCALSTNVQPRACMAQVESSSFTSKHILNAQVSIRAPCCRKFFDVSIAAMTEPIPLTHHRQIPESKADKNYGLDD